MKMNYLFFFSILFLAFTLFSCETDDSESSNNNQSIEGSWILSGGREHLSYGNIHYTFNLSKTSDVSIKLTSDINSYIYIIDNLDLIKYETYNNEFTESLEAGNYELVIATTNRYKRGNFTLDIEAEDISKLTKIESNFEEFDGSWTSSGGRDYNSFRNRHYSFNVPQKTFLNVAMTSAPNEYLYLVDSKNDILEESYNDLSVAVESGNYKLVVATTNNSQPSNGASPNFNIKMLGHFDTPKLIESIELELAGKWENSGGRDIDSPNNPKYTFDVTEECYVDVVLNQDSSKTVSEYLYVVYNDGTIKETYNNIISNQLEKGTYTIVAATTSSGKSGNFTINVYGSHIANLKAK